MAKTEARPLAAHRGGLFNFWDQFLKFCVYLVLILLLIPLQEKGLQQTYDDEYVIYRQSRAKLLPFIF